MPQLGNEAKQFQFMHIDISLKASSPLYVIHPPPHPYSTSYPLPFPKPHHPFSLKWSEFKGIHVCPQSPPRGPWLRD